LSPDHDDGDPQREMEQADRESDRKLVEAYREAEREQRETAAANELVDLLDFGSILVDNHPDADQNEHADRDIVGSITDKRAERAADEKTDDRHRHLETRHQQADAEPLPRRKTAHTERRRDGEGIQAERQHEQDQPDHGSHEANVERIYLHAGGARVICSAFVEGDDDRVGHDEERDTVGDDE
jgi:hypothetical protein